MPYSYLSVLECSRCGREHAAEEVLKRLIAPTTAVADLAACDSASPPVGCRVLELAYTPDTTAPPAAGSTGAYPGRLARVTLRAATPGSSGQASMGSVDVVGYRYDDAGRLREAFDPRLPGLVTGYDYDTAGHVTTLTPPGQLPWTFGYGAATGGDPNPGRLFSVRRATLTPGSADAPNGQAVTTVVYDVPRTKAGGGPRDMTESATAAWGQTGTGVPTDATAIFPPDAVPPGNSGGGAGWDWTRAATHYLDLNGRETNAAEPGGHLDATSYDEHGNTTRELTAGNRELALRSDTDRELVELGLAGQTPAERAEALSTRSVYDDSGLRQLEEYGPLHLLAAGGAPAPGRTHTTNTYDEGRPDGAAARDLLTTRRTGARLAGATSDVDVRTASTDYDWDLGLPTKTTTDPGTGNLAIARTTGYDSQGRVTKTSMPKSSGADAGTTLTAYYTPGAHASVAACGNHPEWADLACQTRPAGAITGAPAGQPTRLPTTTTTYTQLGAPNQATETSTDGSGTSKTRRTDTDYDPAGRPTTVTVTGGEGAPVPALTTAYDPATGARTSTTATSSAGAASTVRRGYDRLGRLITYTDADGATTRTDYDSLDRPTKVASGNGSTTSYAYDISTDPRGLPTGLTDSLAGTITGRYGPDGDLVEQKLPGGVSLSKDQDPTGAPTTRTWTKTDSSGTTELLREQASESAHGQQTLHSGRVSSQAYDYDRAGRLATVQNTQGEACTTRAYGFDADSNRTHKASATGTPDACPDPPALGTADHSYDGADRLIDPGYGYDAFGRTTTKPGVTGIDYYANDLARQVRTNAADEQAWTLDPGLRFRTTTTRGTNPDTGVATTVTKTNHYGDDTDSPDWIEEGNGSISREVAGLDGDLVATTGNTSGSVRLQLTNMHGDATIDLDPAGAGPDLVYDYDEYGQPADTTQGQPRYGWLGAKQRSSEAPAGLILMGVRLYQPSLGRFLQTDPIVGGNANAYDYCNADPINCSDLSGLYSYTHSYGLGRWSTISTRFAVSYFRRHFRQVFPVAGNCRSIKRGRRCVLSGGNPIEVWRASKKGVTIKSLPGHLEGPNKFIRFSFYSLGGMLYLKVHAHGPNNRWWQRIPSSNWINSVFFAGSETVRRTV